MSTTEPPASSGAGEAAAAASQVMQCMEVWGGNQAVETNVTMAGLDAWVYSRPYGGDAAGGGDVHYVSSCATGRITRLLVADVMGHGAAVCDTATSLRSLMRKYVNYLDQTAFVRSLNLQFALLSKAGCFATALAFTFFAPTNSLTVCNAGHPPPMLYRARSRRWSMLEEPRKPPGPRESAADEAGDSWGEGLANFPLGITDLSAYEQFDLTLDVGDVVVAYTDSLIEACDGEGELLGTDGLLNVAQTVDPSDATTFVPRLLAAVATQHEGNLEDDDVTVLLFRPNGAAPRPPLRDKLMAPLRVLRGVARALRPGSGEPMPWPEWSVANIGGALIDPLSRLWKGRGRSSK